jgi:DNA-binding CsgD family transcriptional regulator
MEVQPQPGPVRQSRPPARIVGREREQCLLSELLGAVADDRRQLVMVGGEAGIGKTALVDWLANEAIRRGAHVFTGGCYDLTATPPYGPWLDALERYQPGDDAPPRPVLAATTTTNTQTWFDTVQTFLSVIAASQPLVVILEDLHWSDPASLDLLRHLARSRDRLPVLIVGTYRDDEITREHLLFHFLPLLVREADAERLDLRRLDRTAIASAVGRRYDLSSDDLQRLVDYLARYSDGNPLFLTELLRTLESERLLHHDGEHWTLLEPRDTLIPPLLHQVIDRRLGRLQPATRDALAIAAIIGYEVPVTLWGTVSGLSDEQLTPVVGEAVEAHVLEQRPGGSELRFSHALVREAIHEQMVLPRRHVWHRRVAEALVASPNVGPDAVAYHFQQAGDPRAYEWHVRAGLRARSAARFNAAQHFEAAATLLEGDVARDRERGWLLFHAGELLSFSGDPRSIEHLNASERLGWATDDPVLPALVCVERGPQRCAREDIRRGLHDIRQGVAAIDTLLTTRHSTHCDTEERAIAQRARSGDGSHQSPFASLLAELAVDVTELPAVNLQRRMLAHWLSQTGRYHEAVVVGESFLNNALTATDADHRLRARVHPAHFALGHAYAALGRPDDARQQYALGRAGVTALGDHVMVEHSIWFEIRTVMISYRADQIDERSRLIAEAVREWDRCRGVSTATAGDNAPSELPIHLLEGRWQEALLLATQHLPAPWISLKQEAKWTLGVLARHTGDTDLAWEYVRGVLPQGPATEPGDSWFICSIGTVALAAELALDANDLATARSWIETHDTWLNWSGATLWRPDTELLWARWHERTGDPTLARQHAEASLMGASCPPQPLRIAAAHRVLGQLATCAKQYDDATHHLARSLALASACGAPFERALTLIELAKLRIATGQHDKASALLDDVRAICTPLNARPTLDRAAAIAASIPAGAIGGPSHPDGLTAREVEVLRWIAASHSNREIADALFISPRTIERHIANIYLKIDAHSKAEATAYAQRHHLA